MTWLWWTLGIVVIGAAALVLIAGALLLAVIIDGALKDERTDD